MQRPAWIRKHGQNVSVHGPVLIDRLLRLCGPFLFENGFPKGFNLFQVPGRTAVVIRTGDGPLFGQSVQKSTTIILMN